MPPRDPIQLPDRLWARVQAHLLAADPRPPAEARALVDALVYRALTGVAWSALPPGSPPLAVVRAAYARWQTLGLLDYLAEALGIRLDRDG